MPIRFRVCDVEPPEGALPTVELGTALRSLARDAVALHGPAHVLEGPAINALVHAVHVAFATHRPLALAPDDVWLVVLQGVAQHVARNADRLRDRFVIHEGKALVEIRRDDLHPLQDPPGDWSTVPPELVHEVLERSTATARSLRATFSTTEPASRFAMDVALLDALQSYFSYSVMSLCGIPEIVLLGTPDDWAGILERTNALEGLGLDAWLPPLRDVLAQFVRASRGDVDREFWKTLYKPEGASGGDVVTGWINVLFPYLRESHSSTPRDFTDARENEPKPHELPLALSRAPFTWRLLGEERPMELVAGLVGAALDPALGAVRPRHGWWVAPRTAERAFTITNPSAEPCWVSPRSGKELRTLSSLADETRDVGAIALTLGWCNDLESLDGLERVTRLSRLSMTECNRVTTIAPVARLPAVRELHLSQCKGLTDISALATLPTLESVAIMHCPNLTDHRALACLAEAKHLKTTALWNFTALPERFRKQLTKPEEVAALQAWLREDAAARNGS